MGITNFSQGLSSFGTVVAHGVTAVTGAGTVTTPLDTIVGVNANLAVPSGTAGGSAAHVWGTAHANASGASTFIIRTAQYDGTTAGTVSQNVAWTAFGTKA